MRSIKNATTAIATSTGLSYDRLIKYLDWMVDRGFVKVDSNDNVLLTKLGAKTYDELVKWILQHVGKLRFPHRQNLQIIRKIIFDIKNYLIDEIEKRTVK